MSVDDEIDVVRPYALFDERIEERVAFLHGVDGALLRVPLGAIAGFYHDGFSVSANEQRVGTQADAIFLVRRRFLLPEHFGNNAKHGPAVRSEEHTSEL